MVFFLRKFFRGYFSIFKVPLRNISKQVSKRSEYKSTVQAVLKLSDLVLSEHHPHKDSAKNRQAAWSGSVYPVVIGSCNGQSPGPFSRAEISYDVQEMMNERVAISPKMLFSKATEKLVRLLQALEVEDAELQEQDHRLVHASQCLVDFVHNKESAEQSLRIGFLDEFSFEFSEARIQFLLAEHLFSKLVPDHHYQINKVGIRRPVEECPCGCGVVKRAAIFGLGHPETWHGHPDLLLGRHKLPVAVEGLEPSIPLDAENEEIMEELQKIYDRFDVEFKWGRRGTRIDLLSYDVYQQVMAQTIVHSFLAKKSFRISGFIPSFGCNLFEVSLYMYDCENDILLTTFNNLPLWNAYEAKKTLDLSSIFYIWLCLNYPLLGPSLSQSVVDQLIEAKKQSKFHSLVGVNLLTYQKNVELKCQMIKVDPGARDEPKSLFNTRPRFLTDESEDCKCL